MIRIYFYDQNKLNPDFYNQITLKYVDLFRNAKNKSLREFSEMLYEKDLVEIGPGEYFNNNVFLLFCIHMNIIKSYSHHDPSYLQI